MSGTVSTYRDLGKYSYTETNTFLHDMLCGKCNWDDNNRWVKVLYVLTNGWSINARSIVAYNAAALTNLCKVYGWRAD